MLGLGRISYRQTAVSCAKWQTEIFKVVYDPLQSTIKDKSF